MFPSFLLYLLSPFSLLISLSLDCFQVKNDNQTSDVKSMAEWNTLRKRLISAKMKECKDTKVVNVSDTVYTLVKKIGDGGFSSVYHVYDDKRKSFAIKIVNLLNIDGYTDKDLMNEIELLRVIFHNLFN